MSCASFSQPQKSKLKLKVIVGMSGGVDSAVAALLLKEQGYAVEAVFMKNWEEGEKSSINSKLPSCSAAQDFADATTVCAHLNILLHVVNFSHEYWQRVFQYMLDEYAQGRTPNPDVMCNKEIKFKEFLNHAHKLGADFIATGHYARNVVTASGAHKLYQAVDPTKDQSYFLYTLNQTQLGAALFPLGTLTKNTVRNLARRASLPNYNKKDSTGICFIGERKFKSFLSEYLLAKPGTIVAVDSGAEIGRHDGLMFYTLGQRQGLGIGGRKGELEAPWYVVRKDIERNVLLVAQNSLHPLLMNTTLHCKDLHWIGGEAPSLPLPLRCAAKVRYRQVEQPCTVTAMHKIAASETKISSIPTSSTSATTLQATTTYCVVFDAAQRAITPGQAVVFYAEDGECLGGATIV